MFTIFEGKHKCKFDLKEELEFIRLVEALEKKALAARQARLKVVFANRAKFPFKSSKK
jgi:hypothetical protein